MKFSIEDDRIIGELGHGSLTISGNDQNGYRPFELLISSLAGCSGTILNNILKKKRYPFENLEMTATAVRNPDKAHRIEKISLVAFIYSEKSLDDKQAEKISELVIKNCGMIQSVIETIDIQLKVETLQSK